MPQWHPVSVSGYHIREAGSTAAQELAFTLANGFAYVEAALAAGLEVDEFAPGSASSSTRTSTSSRRSRSTGPPGASGPAGCASATGPRTALVPAALPHPDGRASRSTAQQPEVNIVRVAIEALAGVLGGTQSLHTDAMDEVLALPTEQAARIALRTQQVIADETGVATSPTRSAGPGSSSRSPTSWSARPRRSSPTCSSSGSGSMLEGVFAGIEDGWFPAEIADAAYEFQSQDRRAVNGYRSA